MNKALTCAGNLRTAKRAPILFVHGTTSNSKANWSWNWDRAMVHAICPTELVEHFEMAYGKAARLVGIDALTHAGPAKPALRSYAR
ncbi:MAG: hypothetical protein H7288_22530 [Kineosporiaceae bacterium]|nr:hypothetical protein [Aeromicrobium sp.]